MKAAYSHGWTVFSRMTGAALACTMLLISQAKAQNIDPMVEGAKLCTAHLPRYERQYGIPVHLLSAIASTESGRWHKGLGITLPWPWTINAEGKGYFYPTKEEAVAAARRMQGQGVKSMDIGCMQVNLRHHPNAFSSLEEAFDPEHNVAYAASFLRNLFESERSWRSAAAAYHSKTAVFGTQYVSRVYDRWYTIIDRVRNARINLARSVGGVAAGGGLTSAEAAAVRQANENDNAAQASAATASPPVQLASAQPALVRVSAPVAARQAAAKSSTYAPVKKNSTKIISVRDVGDKPREQGVLVIRPKADAAPKPQKAAYTVADTSAMRDGAPVPKLLNAGTGAAAVKAVAPRFIFSD